MGSKNTVYLTQEGLDDLKKELDNLINGKCHKEIIRNIEYAKGASSYNGRWQK